MGRKKMGRGQAVNLYLEAAEWATFKRGLQARNKQTGETLTPSRVIRRWIFEHNRRKN